MLNFKIYSNGLSSMLSGENPYDVAKTIAAKLNTVNPEYIGDSIYLIGGLKFHLTYIP